VEAARDTLGAAIATAAELPPAIGAIVGDVARNAFVEGMQVVATISAVVAIGVAILVLVALRDVRLDHDAAEAGGAASDGVSERLAPERRLSGTPVPEA
jgi:DHA2 family multidrug resistance protein-like MFS transporter